MKVDPIEILLNKKIEINKSFYFISGNEPTLIEKVKQIIISLYNQKNTIKYNKIKDITQYRRDVGLFDNNIVYLVSDTSGLNNEILDGLDTKDDVFIFVIENSPKIKHLKNIFINRKDSYLIDCYELTKDQKARILKSFVDNKKIKLNEDNFWSLVEKLDNKYVFLEKELEKLSDFESGEIKEDVIEKIITKDTSGLEKIFFEILQNNERLVNIYNDRVTNQKEANDFYYSFRQFCYLIINNNNQTDFSKNIPKYLFRERGFLINVFNKYNNKKKNLLIKLMLNTEKGLRFDGSLSVIIGLRFLLSFKKITIS